MYLHYAVWSISAYLSHEQLDGIPCTNLPLLAWFLIVKESQKRRTTSTYPFVRHCIGIFWTNQCKKFGTTKALFRQTGSAPIHSNVQGWARHLNRQPAEARERLQFGHCYIFEGHRSSTGHGKTKGNAGVFYDWCLQLTCERIWHYKIQQLTVYSCCFGSECSRYFHSKRAPTPTHVPPLNGWMTQKWSTCAEKAMERCPWVPNLQPQLVASSIWSFPK